MSINPDRIASLLAPYLSWTAVRTLMVELAKVPSPQTELFEAEPLLRTFIQTAVAPRVETMGFKDIRFDSMGNLIASYGANRSGASLMLCSNAMNQPQATMKNAYSGDIIDGRPHGLPGEAVMGKGLSEQKATMGAMLHAMDVVIRSGVAIEGRLVFLCCVSGETGRHDAIRNVVETEGVRADMCLLGGNGNRISLGNRGRIDVFITVKGVPSHSSRPHDGCNAITGAFEVHRRLLEDIKLTGSHPQLGKQTLTINHIRSFPESTHTVQDRCELVVDRRLLPEDDPNVAFEQIEEGRHDRRRREGPGERQTVVGGGQAWAVHVSFTGDDRIEDRKRNHRGVAGDDGHRARDDLQSERLRSGLSEPCRNRMLQLRPR